MDTELIILQFGYLGLFVISFLAASIVPLSSELFVLAMPPLGFNIWLVGFVATFGNYVGALSMYYMGAWGSDFVLSRYVTLDEKRVAQAQKWFRRWGPSVLLLAGIPIIGDPICGVAGMLKMNLGTFSFWAFLGKGWRYVLLLGAWQWVLQWFGG